MTFWEILNNLADLCIVTAVLIVLLSILVLTVYSFITKKTIDEIMQEFDREENLEDDEYIKRLDKLQETVDCLASKHIDNEAMKELFRSSDSMERENRIENTEQKNDEP